MRAWLRRSAGDLATATSIGTSIRTSIRTSILGVKLIGRLADRLGAAQAITAAVGARAQQLSRPQMLVHGAAAQPPSRP